MGHEDVYLNLKLNYYSYETTYLYSKNLNFFIPLYLQSVQVHSVKEELKCLQNFKVWLYSQMFCLYRM
jgi:hypothetical protein